MLPLADILALFRWWLALMMIGAIATPLTWWFFGGSGGFGRLPSLGYAFAKPLGLLLVSYLFWILGSLGFLSNTTGSILFAAIIVIGLSIFAQRQRTVSIQDTVRRNWRFMLATELLFTVLLIFWAWARAQNPAILNTEKPMEFAFLNAVTRSQTFPPLDPWLSGFAISYYYFGYVMMSVVARLAAVQNAVAFNLATAWLYAATGLGAFSLVYDLVTLQARKRIYTMAISLGVLGALAVGLAGNLEIVLEVLHYNGVGSAELWAAIDIQDINTPPGDGTGTARYETSSWWWWRSSRLINERTLAGTTEGVIEPIAEFPSFSFALGDVHPHVLALPYAFLSMAVALVWYLSRSPLTVGRASQPLDQQLRHFQKLLTTHWPHFLLTVLIIGGLSFLNTWDVLIYTWLLIAAIALSAWRQQQRWTSNIIRTAVFWTAAFGIFAYVAYLPFYIGFSSQAGAPFILPMLMQPTRLVYFLGIFGMPLLAITILIGVLVAQQRGRQWKSGALTAAGLLCGLLLLMLLMSVLIAASPVGYGPIASLADQLGLGLPPLVIGESALAQLGWAFRAVSAVLPTILTARIGYFGVSLLLLLLIAGCVMLTKEQFEQLPATDPERESKPQSPSPLPFLLLLILTGALLTLGPEYVYLKDNFGQRINTIFKFYYQAWAMFGVAAVVGLYILSQRTRLVGLITASGYLALFAGAMLFPYYMIQWGAAWHGQEPTLNGLTFVQNNNPNEYDAIMWLQQHTDGTPVVLEATGGAYSDFARVSARTGLPTVLGWANHERQWRGITSEPDERDPIIRTIYSQPDWGGIPELLDRYNVTYIYVGHIERDSYGLTGLDKFDENLEVAFQNETVTIYAYRPRGG